MGAQSGYPRCMVAEQLVGNASHTGHGAISGRLDQSPNSSTRFSRAMRTNHKAGSRAFFTARLLSQSWATKCRGFSSNCSSGRSSHHRMQQLVKPDVGRLDSQEPPTDSHALPKCHFVTAAGARTLESGTSIAPLTLLTKEFGAVMAPFIPTTPKIGAKSLNLGLAGLANCSFRERVRLHKTAHRLA